MKPITAHHHGVPGGLRGRHGDRGRIIDAVGTRISYALFLFLWSVAAMLHAAVNSAMGFAFMRAFLGLSEAGNFPAAIKTVAEWFPGRTGHSPRHLQLGRQHRCNTRAGDGPWLAARWGWKAAFIATGALGFIWLVFWFIYYNSPATSRRLWPRSSTTSGATARRTRRCR